MNLNVTVVIPSWNGRDILEKNLPMVIQARKIKSNKIVEIIVVDDASTDGTVGFLDKNFAGEIVLIRRESNGGFSATVNDGVVATKSGLVVLLNMDVVPSANFLEATLVHFKDRSVFAVSLHERGYGAARAKFESGYIIHEPVEERKRVQESFWANGGSGVFRKSIWEELGGLDSELLSPFYWEDVDLGYRAMKRGYKILWEPAAMVVHRHESVINTKNFDKKYMDLIKERNQLLVIWKNIISPSLFRKHMGGVTRRVFAHPGYIRVVIAALAKLMVVRRRRAVEKRESTVSDESVFARFG